MFALIRKWCKSRQYNLPDLAPLTDEQIDECFEKAWDDPDVAGVRTPYGDTQKEYFKRIITRRARKLNDSL